MSLKTSDFDYDLPNELIAQHPEEKRDHSRLLVVDRETGELEDKHFYDIIDYLNEGDVLVYNDTKVLPARLYGQKETGARIEVLLLKRLSGDKWECLVRPGRKARPGDVIHFSDDFSARVLRIKEEGIREVRLHYNGTLEENLDACGEMPLPPYIHEKLEEQDRYQTIYARVRGSAAAPTAGLHFTPEILKKIKEKGVELIPLTLHVGLGTFRPVKEDNIEDHHMHEESYSISTEAADRINKAKEEGRRVIATGTTTLRALEAATDENGQVVPGVNSTDIFIYPGVKIKTADALITNFHLPKSTLLMLVSAFYDKEKILEAYRHAVDENYRFFSFGDAMFIK